MRAQARVQVAVEQANSASQKILRPDCLYHNPDKGFLVCQVVKGVLQYRQSWKTLKTTNDDFCAPLSKNLVGKGLFYCLWYCFYKNRAV